MKSKKDVLKQFKEHYEVTRSGLKAQWRHIKECEAFYAGDYMNYRDEMQFGRGSSRRVREVSFNRVKPYVNAIVGFFAQSRKKPDYQAKMDTPQQDMYTDYLNGFSDYVRENTNADQQETRQDKDLIIGGVGVTDTAITLKDGSASRDPNGEILEERVDPKEVGWDPAAVHPNLLDARWVYRVKDYDLDEAMELFNADEEDFEVVDDEERIDNYHYNPYGGIQDKIGFEWADKDRRLVRVYFYSWSETEPYYRVENPLAGAPNAMMQLQLAEALAFVESDEQDELFAYDPGAEILTLTRENRKQVKDIFEAFGIPFKPVSLKRKVFYSAILSGDKVFDAFKAVSQQGFSLKFKTGDRDEVNRIWTGIVTSMREPQRYYNKSLTELMLIIANNSRGGVIYEEDAVDNIQEFENQYVRYNTAVRVNRGAISGGKIKDKAVPAMPTGYENILGLSNENFSYVTGIDESIFGVTGGGNETALLQRQRLKQATTVLAVYVDSIELYTKEQARMMLSFMRMLADASDGRMFMMRDDEGNNIFERLSPDFFADEYVIAIGEAPTTEIQQDYYTQTLLTMGQSMLSVGDPTYKTFYAGAVKYMPIPERDKNQIINALEGEQIDPRAVQEMARRLEALQSEQARLQMAGAAADIEKTRVEVEETKADIQATLAKAQKTQFETAKVQEETEQTARENDLMGTGTVNVNI